MNGQPCRVVIVDDHPLMRQGLKQLLSLEPGFEVVAEGESGRMADALVEAHRPDLLLLDLNMPDGDGHEALGRVQACRHRPKVVVFTVSNDEHDVIAALRAGADGYLLKDMHPDDMLDALQRAAKGHTVISPGLSECLARAVRGDVDDAAPSVEDLTAREREILAGIAKGMSNKAIAQSFGITLETVKVHTRNILAKLNVSSRVGAAVWAVQHGIK